MFALYSGTFSFVFMITVAMIPARYDATRFPAKLMQLLGDKTVIRRTYDATKATGLFDPGDRRHRQ